MRNGHNPEQSARMAQHWEAHNALAMRRDLGRRVWGVARYFLLAGVAVYIGALALHVALVAVANSAMTGGAPW